VGFKLTTLVVIGTDCIGSCKSNYHTITNMTITALQFPDPVIPQVYRQLLPVISQVLRFIGPLVLQYHMIPDPTKLQVHGPLILQYHRFINLWSYNTTGYYVISNTILQHHMIPDRTISQVHKLLIIQYHRLLRHRQHDPATSHDTWSYNITGSKEPKLHKLFEIFFKKKYFWI
jgi:hypothetical protein